MNDTISFQEKADRIILKNRVEHKKRLKAINLRIKESTLRYIKHIEICGYFYRNINDQVPSHGCFTMEGKHTIDLPSSNGLEDAKNKAFIEFTVLNDEFEKEAGTDDNFDPYDGLFSPSCILLLDQFGECITRYKNSEWQESHDLPSKDEYEALMAKSQQLRNDASIEAGWDNFSTAQSMRCEARNIELLIQMSKNIARLDNT